MSKQHLAPGAYLRYIGLGVAYRLLDEAFEETYSLPLRGILGRRRPAIRSYRTSVRSFLPRIAYAETVIHKHDFPPDVSNESLQLFLDYIAQADFQPVWNRYRHKAGIGTRLLALLIIIVPKIGALSDLAIKIPTQDTQDLYVKSMNRSIEFYADALRQFATAPDISPPIANLDLDTGEKSRPGAYALTDKTYAKLLHDIASNPQRSITAGLRQDILDFYSDPNAPITTKKDKNKWADVMKDLGVLRGMPVAVGASE